MKLFEIDNTFNILPQDGIVHYYGKILSDQDSQSYMQRLLKHIPWKNDEAVIFGRHIITKRKVAWFGDQSFGYTYSKKTREALPWTEDLIHLKSLVEKISGEKYNSCLLNLYHNGDEGMAWHSDDEKTMAKNSAIASLSIGAERKFSFRHKQSKETISTILENGSLLVMKGNTQSNWLHSIPKTKTVSDPRINLTFRIFNPD